MHQFYFSKPERFNDPFDFNTNFIFRDRNDRDIQVIFNRIRKGVKDQIEGNFNAAMFDKRFLTNGKPNKEFEDYVTNKGNEGIKELQFHGGSMLFREL